MTKGALPDTLGQLTPYMASLRRQMKSDVVKKAHRPSVQQSSDRMCCSTRWKSVGSRITNVRECVSSPMQDQLRWNRETSYMVFNSKRKTHQTVSRRWRLKRRLKHLAVAPDLKNRGSSLAFHHARKMASSRSESATPTTWVRINCTGWGRSAWN